MNKTTNINLGGFPFIIDESAYLKLERYLNAIRKHFTSYDSYQDILNDIELRVGELLNDRPHGRLIVGDDDIDQVIRIMGRPEDFGADPIEEPIRPGQEADFDSGTAGTSEHAYKTGKKLFIDPRNKIVGGVCGGLGAYFNINPNAFRIGFVILTLSGGLGLPLYVLLWIFLPKPKSAGDYLAMTGKNASVTNIAEFFEKQFNRFSHEVNELSDEVKEKFSKQNFSNSARPVIQDIEDNVRYGWQQFSKFLKPFLTIIGIVMLAAFGILWITMIIGFIASLPFLKFVTSSSGLINFISGLNSFIVFTIPLVFLIMWALRLLFKTQISPALRQSLFIFWITNLVSLIILGSLTASEFKARNDYEVRQSLEFVPGQTIILRSGDQHSNKHNFQIGYFGAGDEGTMNVDYDNGINIYPAESDKWYAIKNFSSQGTNMSDARKNIECISYELSKTTNELIIPKYFTIKKDCKYRFQNLKVDLYIPVGAQFKIDPEMQWKLRDVKTNPEKMKNGFIYVEGRTYSMTREGLVCTDCTDEDYQKYSSENIETGLDLDELPADYVMQSMESTETNDYTENKTLNVSMDKIMVTNPGQTAMDNLKINFEPGEINKITRKAKMKYYLDYALAFNPELYKSKLKGNEFTLSNTYPLSKHDHLKNPEMEITVRLPIGTKIKFKDSIEDFIGDVKYAAGSENEDLFDNDNIWEVTAEGLKCTNCE